MLRTWMATGAFALVMTAAASSSAQDARGFGTKGQLIFSADRLVPLFAYTSNKVSFGDGSSQSVHSTSLSVLPNLNGLGGSNNSPVFYNVPRLAFDYTIIDRLTLGGSIAFAVTPGAGVDSKDGAGRTVSTDAATTTYFSIAPRVGYILPLSEMFAFWPRGGLSFHTLSTKAPDQNTTRTDSFNQWAINLEAMFALVPVQNFFFLAGPVIDIPLTGTTKSEVTRNGATVSQSNDFSSFHTGLSVGLGGYINL
jgi:hypothetical protein